MCWSLLCWLGINECKSKGKTVELTKCSNLSWAWKSGPVKGVTGRKRQQREHQGNEELRRGHGTDPEMPGHGVLHSKGHVKGLTDKIKK